ncbi:MAG: hypothetical protein JXB07_09710 [Anaerolineae bacterium]|nr:hypothetical protein [Anaerolineae bacterium]
MPRDERRHQQKLMKRRQKTKASTKARNARTAADNPRLLLRGAREYPILECLINDDWDHVDSQGPARILIARSQPNGGIAFGVYFVDRLCMGVKDTFCGVGYTASEYATQVPAEAFAGTNPTKCPPELIHQIIYQSVDYAAQFGFKPQRDFKWTRYLLEEQGSLDEPYDLTFGKDGKPCFVAGEGDNVKVVLGKLEKYAGPGNYEYVPFSESSADAPQDNSETTQSQPVE